MPLQQSFYTTIGVQNAYTTVSFALIPEMNIQEKKQNKSSANKQCIQGALELTNKISFI